MKAARKTELTAERNISPVAMTLRDIVITTLSLFIFIYHMSAAFFGEPEAFTLRTTHLFLFVTVLPFFKPLCKEGETNHVKLAIDALFVLLSVFVLLYYTQDIDALQIRTQAGDITWLDRYVAMLVLVLVLEATRRTVGNMIVIISLFFIAHAVYSDYFVGILYGPPVRFETIVEFQAYRADGIFGIPIMVTASFVTIFIFFGAFLEKCGAGTFFIKMAVAATRRLVGGPAKASVCASASFGTMSGSSVANVMVTGLFTIPLMKRAGYPAHFASAVEAVASTGGMIMPPAMGAAAFVMAAFLGIPYVQVCVHAAIPACLYFFSLFMMVHFRSKKLGFAGLQKLEAPPALTTLREGWFYLVPLATLIVILAMGRSPAFAAFCALLSVYAASLCVREARMGIDAILDAIKHGTKTCLVVVMACACAGLITGTISLSGLGLRLTSMILEISQNSVVLALLLTMTASLILGMGLTATVIYIMLSVLVIPAVVKMGIVPIAAHMFCFYYGVISVITPPVAVAAYAAAGLGGAPPWKTGFMAFQLGITSFLVPFYFVFNPELLLIGPVVTVVWATFTAIIGVVCLAAALEGWVLTKASVPEKVILAVAALQLIKPGGYSDIIGGSCLMVVMVYQICKARKLARATTNGLIYDAGLGRDGAKENE